MTQDPATPLPIRIPQATCTRLDEAEGREWILADGRGGYACGTVAGTPTRRYHGLLIDAVTPPTGRQLLLHSIQERVLVGDASFDLATNRWSDESIHPRGCDHLVGFELEGRTPTWTWSLGGRILQRRLALRDRTVQVHWSTPDGDHPMHLQFSLLVSNRSHHGLYQAGELTPCTTVEDGAATIRWPFGPSPVLEVSCEGTLMARGSWWRGFRLAEEEARGFPCREDAWEALEGEVVIDPRAGAQLHAGVDAGVVRARPDLVAAAREADRGNLAAAGEASADTLRGRMVVAASQFLADRRHADGGVGKTLIAGFPWFTDWGRDTMISLPGLVLETGHHEVAGEILRTFAAHEHAGLIPNVFDDRGGTPMYNTVDASLLFIEAVRRWHEATGDDHGLRDLWPTVSSIIEHYRTGTLHGIGVDERDSLLHAGEPGLQLTWMDARVGDHVITPRRGKPVEINAFWYRALRTAASFATVLGEPSEPMEAAAVRVRNSFKRFWNPDTGGLFDVLDGPEGDDPAIRPNQLLALGAASDLVDREQALGILGIGREQLLVTMGVRSLSPEHGGFVSRYEGSPAERDAAYHQGTAWPWLLGAYVEACRSVGTGDGDRVARAVLGQLARHLLEAGMGTVSEILDGMAPNRPRGCFAQAWSVAAMLDILRTGGGSSVATGSDAHERRSQETSGVG